MPFGDATGPAGLGPMTGRGLGNCAGYSYPGYMNSAPGRGYFGRAAFGRGRGRGWFGRGRGMGRGWARGYWGYQPYPYQSYPYEPYPSIQPTAKEEKELLTQEKEMLAEEAKALKENLKVIENRIQELGTKKK